MPLREIRRALENLWTRCDAQEWDGNLSRSMTMNFLGVARAEDADRLEADMQRLVARHPCRAFVIIADEHRTESSVAARAVVRSNSRQIQLELVRLRAPASQFERLAGVIRPLLVADLPVNLYWGTHLPRRLDRLRLVAELADRTTVDSGLFEDPVVDLGRLQTLHDAEDHRLAIEDLTWLRLQPWRYALASAFERVSWNRRHPTEAEVCTARSCGSTAAGFVLAQWLRERLRARVQVVPETSVDSNPNAAIDMPRRVHLRFGPCHIAVQAVADGGPLEVQVTTDKECHLPYRVPAFAGSDLLGQAISSC